MKKGKVIVISGKKRVGKDTVASILEEIISVKGKNHCRLALAGRIKRMLAELTGNGTDYLDDNKEAPLFNNNLTPRDMYRKIGDLIRDNLGQNYLVDQVISNCNKLSLYYDYILITDMRYLHEYEELKKINPIFIRVKKNIEGDTHSSEVDLDNLADSNFDYVIENKGNVKELEEKLRTLFHGKL
jgi:hypothetical protein